MKDRRQHQQIFSVVDTSKDANTVETWRFMVNYPQINVIGYEKVSRNSNKGPMKRVQVNSPVMSDYIRAKIKDMAAQKLDVSCCFEMRERKEA